MRVLTHVAITKAVAKYLSLNPRFVEFLVRGVREPDYVWRRRRSHHIMHPYVIMDAVWEARRRFLQGDLEETARILGVALHIVQDKCFVSARKRYRRIHARVEKALKALDIDYSAVAEGIEKATCSYRYVEDVLRSLTPSTDPREAMRKACFYTATIVASTLCRCNISQDFIEKLRNALKRCREMKKRFARKAFATLATATTISIPLHIAAPALKTAILSVLLLVTIFTSLAYLAVCTADKEYRELTTQAKWCNFNLKNIE